MWNKCHKTFLKVNWRIVKRSEWSYYLDQFVVELKYAKNCVLFLWSGSVKRGWILNTNTYSLLVPKRHWQDRNFNCDEGLFHILMESSNATNKETSRHIDNAICDLKTIIFEKRFIFFALLFNRYQVTPFSSAPIGGIWVE